VPPLSNQMPGRYRRSPIAINDTTFPTAAGPGCWRLLLGTEPAHDEVLSPTDSNDSRMQQVVFSDGKLYGALDTVVNVGAVEQAGAAFYVIRPNKGAGRRPGGRSSRRARSAVAGNNLTYPAVAALPNGKAGDGLHARRRRPPPERRLPDGERIDGRRSDPGSRPRGVGPEDGFLGPTRRSAMRRARDPAGATMARR